MKEFLDNKGVAGVATLVAVVAVTGASVGTPVVADSVMNLNPDSPIYSLERAGESIKEMTYAGGENWHLDRAMERTEEYKKMVKENKGEKYIELLEQSENRFVKAINESKRKKSLERVREKSMQHTRILENLENKVPAKARVAISLAKSKSSQYRVALSNVEENEDLDNNSLENINKEVEKVNKQYRHLRKRAYENLEEGNVNNVVRNINKNAIKNMSETAKKAISDKNNKMMKTIANEMKNKVRAMEEVGIENNDNVQGIYRAIKSTRKHISILENVSDTVPKPAKSAIQNAIEKSKKGLNNIENVAKKQLRKENNKYGRKGKGA